MVRKKAVVAGHVRKKASPRASVSVLIKRQQKKLAKLKERQKLIDVKRQVADLQRQIKEQI